MSDEQLWTREEALDKLRAINGSREKIKEWNDYRDAHQEWIPDLSEEKRPENLRGWKLTDTTRRENESPLPLDLHCANLRHADLRKTNFNSADLRDANLSGASLRGAYLSDADLSYANLTEGMLRGAHCERADLSNAILTKADFRGANLSGAILGDVDLTGSKLVQANLARAILERANLTEADMSGVILTSAHLLRANLTSASLVNANLISVDLRNANFTGADLYAVNLTDANVTGVIYNRCKMRGKCTGARVANCYGNAIFKREVEDQDFIDTLKDRLESECKIATEFWAVRKAKWNLMLFRAWRRIDYGRSVWQASLIAIRFAFLFGLVFFCDMKFSWGLMDYSGSANSLFTPFYYSIVTYTTLGFGDVTPKNWGGEVLVVAEVMFGYLTLGLLISILANKVARRS